MLTLQKHAVTRVVACSTACINENLDPRQLHRTIHRLLNGARLGTDRTVPTEAEVSVKVDPNFLRSLSAMLGCLVPAFILAPTVNVFHAHIDIGINFTIATNECR